LAFVQDYSQFIDGRWVPAMQGGSTLIADPSTGKVMAAVPCSTEADVDAAVAAAQRAAPEWATTPPSERAAALRSLADALDASLETLALLESANAGKPLAAARREVTRSADRLRFFAGAAQSMWGLPAGEYVRGATSFVRREPVGVAGLITPWNYPLHMASWKVGPALAAGNTCVLKPADLTPVTALELARLSEGLLPPGVLNVVCGDGKVTGAAVARHPGVDMVALTGGVGTGRDVVRAAADSLKRVHLELGGKAPAIVLPDADPAAVAARLRIGSFWNSGQDCTAAARILVCEAGFDDVVAALLAEAGSIRVGDPLDPDTEMGPLISAHHRTRVLGFVERAVTAGAQVVLGGGGTDLGPAYMEPTVLVNVSQTDEIVQQEVFGPVITVQRVADEADALRLANDVPYGLAASVWTSDLDRALDLTRQLNFGTVWVNEHGPIASEMPFGGFGASGYGTDLSAYVLNEYTRLKHVMVYSGRLQASI
jgi:betaine-aldehyde dehydrogenase